MAVIDRSDEWRQRPSAFSVKKTSFYDEVKDRIDGVMFHAQLAEVTEWLDVNDYQLPAGWRDAFDNMIELKREELEAEATALRFL